MHPKFALVTTVLLAASAALAASTAIGDDPRSSPKTAFEIRFAGIIASTNEIQTAAIVGLVPSSPRPNHQLRAVPTPGAVDAEVPVAALPATTAILGIPEVALAAYRNAELSLAATQPGCGLTWNLLAGIGKIESDHASGGRTDRSGTTLAPIHGPTLDGHLAGNEVIPAQSGGFASAIGPMQFLPDTWNVWATDGNLDGVSDPNNVFDAALASAKYLCAGEADLRDISQRLRAVLRYNNSLDYAEAVMRWSTIYAGGGLLDPGDLSYTASDLGIADAVVAEAKSENARMAQETVEAPTTSPTTTTTTTTTTAPRTTLPRPIVPTTVRATPPPPVVTTVPPVVETSTEPAPVEPTYTEPAYTPPTTVVVTTEPPTAVVVEPSAPQWTAPSIPAAPTYSAPTYSAPAYTAPAYTAPVPTVAVPAPKPVVPVAPAVPAAPAVPVIPGS
ncbi:lytic transglycosylase domain-containing protein [Antrihabitans stalactiti]|uniref:lytic transglycosylase domain-containing protein n=1 Tax=Antrihabitans stalactiti TaxID=2584121 RepID=UPI00198121AC|nr:lytic murein transglycosylase [Antrihabitans stalactiti]